MSDSNGQKPAGYGHDKKGAAGGAAYGDGKPGVAHTAPADKVAGKGDAPTAKTFTIDDREIDIRDGETIFRAARRLGINLPHLCYLPQARLSAGRQLPGLHGRDRGRARAGGKLHSHAVAGHEGQDPDRPRQDRAQDGRRTFADRSAGSGASRTIPDSELWKIATGMKIEQGRFPRRRHARAGSQPSWRWRSISTPASSAISASAPAAKCRSMTSSAWPAAVTAKRSCSTSTIRWALRPASPAANACRPARPAR